MNDSGQDVGKNSRLVNCSSNVCKRDSCLVATRLRQGYDGVRIRAHKLLLRRGNTHMHANTFVSTQGVIFATWPQPYRNRPR